MLTTVLQITQMIMIISTGMNSRKTNTVLTFLIDGFNPKYAIHRQQVNIENKELINFSRRGLSHVSCFQSQFRLATIIMYLKQKQVMQHLIQKHLESVNHCNPTLLQKKFSYTLIHKSIYLIMVCQESQGVSHAHQLLVIHSYRCQGFHS